MNAQRIAGLVALTSGGLLILALVALSVAGPAAFGNGATSASSPVGPDMMGIAPGGMGMGGAGHDMMGSGPAAIPGATEVRIQAANFSFTPNEVRLPKNADVNLTFTSAGTGVVHDFTVPGLGLHVAANPGETKTIGLRGLAAGRYDAVCSVPGHADLGMRAIVIVE